MEELNNKIDFEDVILNIIEPFFERLFGMYGSNKKFFKDKFLFENAKFVFEANDIEKIKEYLIEADMPLKDISIIIEKLNKIRDDYYDKNKRNRKKSSVYIKVKDCDEFFILLYQIYDIYMHMHLQDFQISSPMERIHYLWLRMGVDDVNDVIKFLKKQLAFAKNSALFEQHPVEFGTYKDLDIYYKNECNFVQFETDAHMLFSFKSRVSDKFYECDFDTFLDALEECKEFQLPVIHYGLKKDENIPTCYIYGIQNLHPRQDKEMLLHLIELRNSLLNSYVSPFNIMALKLFIDLLEEKGIRMIKVPLIQVFDYDFHNFLSNGIADELAKYMNVPKDKIEETISSLEGVDYNNAHYDYLKRQYERFFNKEDLISFNKTERLIYTFMVLEEKFGNIEILNEPFISGEYLIVKIKPREKTMCHFEELQSRSNKKK